jgi:hypothetical protein
MVNGSTTMAPPCATTFSIVSSSEPTSMTGTTAPTSASASSRSSATPGTLARAG